MKPRVFLDTNVFIFAFEFRDSNSHTIIELINTGRIEAVVTEMVLKEVVHYFRKFYDRTLANEFRNYILQSCILVFSEEVKEQMTALENRIKDKDLAQIAVVRALGLKYLVSYDKDFKGFEEYTTPKRFVEAMGLKSKRGEV